MVNANVIYFGCDTYDDGTSNARLYARGLE